MTHNSWTKRNRISCTGKMALFVVLLLVLFFLSLAFAKAGGPTTYEVQQRVPVNFYARAVDLGGWNLTYRQPEESNDCFLYAVAYLLRVDPSRLNPDRVNGATDYAGLEQAAARLGRPVRPYNSLLVPGGSWRDVEYSQWRAEDENYLRTHLPAIVFPEVPGGDYHAVVVISMTRTRAIFFDPKLGHLLSVPQDDFYRARLGDKYNDGGYVIHRRVSR